MQGQDLGTTWLPVSLMQHFLSWQLQEPFRFPLPSPLVVWRTSWPSFITGGLAKTLSQQSILLSIPRLIAVIAIQRPASYTTPGS
mmetsp:Transcript_136664/g.241507  ORF Transcript_136664/g.241507 Transcript_136664/m.241507 type:complete len:85 (+) Transcript_136664:212-466(+)